MLCAHALTREHRTTTDGNEEKQRLSLHHDTFLMITQEGENPWKKFEWITHRKTLNALDVSLFFFCKRGRGSLIGTFWCGGWCVVFVFVPKQLQRGILQMKFGLFNHTCESSKRVAKEPEFHLKDFPLWLLWFLLKNEMERGKVSVFFVRRIVQTDNLRMHDRPKCYFLVISSHLCLPRISPMLTFASKKSDLRRGIHALWVWVNNLFKSTWMALQLRWKLDCNVVLAWLDL